MYHANRTVDRLMKQTGRNLILEQHSNLHVVRSRVLGRLPNYLMTVIQCTDLTACYVGALADGSIWRRVFAYIVRLLINSDRMEYRGCVSSWKKCGKSRCEHDDYEGTRKEKAGEEKLFLRENRSEIRSPVMNYSSPTWA